MALVLLARGAIADLTIGAVTGNGNTLLKKLKTGKLMSVRAFVNSVHDRYTRRRRALWRRRKR